MYELTNGKHDRGLEPDDPEQWNRSRALGRRPIYLRQMSAKVQAWFDALPEERQDRAERVRELLMDASPTMTEEWKYNIPFFCNEQMCYLSLQKSGLVVGSVDGVHLLDVDGLFAPPSTN